MTYIHRPLIAIMRGITPDSVIDVCETLVTEGITVLEVTMNSPDTLGSVARMVRRFGGRAVVGAGTVTELSQVDAVRDAGGTFIVSPNTDPEIIARTKAIGMNSYPGCQTATDCFAALKAGADVLKIFPGGVVGSYGVRALRDTLPTKTEVYTVGGANPDNMAEFRAAGATGFGFGSALYKPGKSLDNIARDARAVVAAWDAID